MNIPFLKIFALLITVFNIGHTTEDIKPIQSEKYKSLYIMKGSIPGNIALVGLDNSSMIEEAVSIIRKFKTENSSVPYQFLHVNFCTLDERTISVLGTNLSLVGIDSVYFNNCNFKFENATAIVDVLLPIESSHIGFRCCTELKESKKRYLSNRMTK